MNKISIINGLRKYIKNYISVAFNIYKHREKIKVVFKDGHKEILDRNLIIVSLIEQLYGIKLVGTKDNGELGPVFLNEDYKFLKPINGNIVIDIGANIGDSTVWFGIMGASKIIALEPYQHSFKTAVQNIELNHLGNKVVILKAGYGKDAFIEIENKISNIGTVLEEHIGGDKTPIFSLKTILDKYVPKDVKGLLLKMDCEGCEYNILTESDQTLKKFSKIIIEYHNGYEKLKNKLKDCGFSVKYTDPVYSYNPDANRSLIQGYIFAYNP
jgi:FkbM family methyltransferase